MQTAFTIWELFMAKQYKIATFTPNKSKDGHNTHTSKTLQS